MIVRNGVRSALRARGRTALFALLLLILTAALTLGLGMWSYCAGVLADMDEGYTSIALFEYMGEDYPDADAADEYARQAAEALDGEAISAVDGVELWEQTDAALFLLEGYQRSRGDIPYRDYGVLVVSGLYPYYQHGWGELREETLPEERLVRNSVTGDLTLIVPDLEPLVVPAYFYEEDIGYYRNLEEGDREVVEKEALPELCYLDEGDLATLTGELPEAYQPYQAMFMQSSGWYYYVPDSGVYMGNGEILAGYAGRASAVYAKEGKESFAAVFEIDDMDFEPEYGKQYLVHGKFVESASSNRRFAVTDFYEGCETPPYLELSGSEDPALTESIFIDYADYYRMANNYARVEASAGIAALEVFQQGILRLEDGRFPEPGEAGVCVISGLTAAQMGVGVGDTVSVSLLACAPEDQYDLTETGDCRQWEIVGVTNVQDSYEGCLWVSDAEGDFGEPLFGYGLGRAVLDNTLARQAADATQAAAPDGVRVTLYDQGYAAAAQPLETMRVTAMAVTIASLCGALVVLILFGYLFVGRQRETVGILVSLGTPAGKIRLWLLSGGAVIAAAAALIGAAAGGSVLGRVIETALSTARALYAVDTRYSEAAIGMVNQVEVTAEVPVWPAVASGVLVFLAALLMCLAFLRLARNQSAPKKGKLTVRVPRGGTSTAGRGAPRFAALSAKRGGWRSRVVPAVSLVLVLLLGALAAAARDWDRQMDRVYEESRIQGQVVSTNGRNFTGLTVSTETARTLWQSGMLEEISASLGWNYWLPGTMPSFGSNSFGEETRAAWISARPKIIAANSLSSVPEFYYSGAPEINWLDGWDESFLSGNEYPSFLRMVFGEESFGGEEMPVYPALVSSRFLKEQGLELGSEFAVMLSVKYTLPSSFGGGEREFYIGVNLKAVGSFPSAGSGGDLYVPLSFWMDPAWLTGEGITLIERSAIQSIDSAESRDNWFYSVTSLDTCRFTLASAYDLEAFRSYLAEQAFSQVGLLTRNRTTILLRDQAFTEMVGGLGRYITFSRAMFPVLLVLIGLLGFVISWLMVNGRRMEFAVMRGLGASKGRVFASFFLEQAGLCALGCVVGALALTIPWPGAAVWLAAAGFLACYLIGCALSVAAVGRTKLMALLSERE